MQTPVAECPLSVGKADSNFILKGTSYFANDYTQGGGISLWNDLGGKTSSQINNPSKLVLWADNGAYSKALNSNSLYWRYYHEPRKAQYGFAFVDGSAKQAILDTGEGIAWQSNKLTFVAETN